MSDRTAMVVTLDDGSVEPLSYYAVEAAVLDFFGVHIDQLVVDRRSKKVSNARRVLCTIANRHCGMTICAAATMIGKDRNAMTTGVCRLRKAGVVEINGDRAPLDWVIERIVAAASAEQREMRSVYGGDGAREGRACA